MINIIDFVLHVDKYIGVLIETYGLFVYVILFSIIFFETGLVITPFLPGDSLLFITGAFAAQGELNIIFLFFLLSIAAILGDTLNYWIGNYFGENVFAKSKIIKAEYLEKTKKFYDKHGAKTIILARFVPIIRTFAPFVAGVGKMRYYRFLVYNIIGGIAWIAIFLFAGYFFGSLKFVERNFTIIVYLIILVSITPAIIEYVRQRRKQ